MSEGTVGIGGVGLVDVGGGISKGYRLGVDQIDHIPLEAQSLVPIDVPAFASMEMNERPIEWGGGSAMEASYPALYDIGVPPRPEITMRDPIFDPTYYYSAQSAQMAPVLVDEAGSLPAVSPQQPLGPGGFASPAEAMMYASLGGVVGVPS